MRPITSDCDDRGTIPDLRKVGSGAKGTRTRDPLLAKQVLFQLSYSPFACRRPVSAGLRQQVRPRCRTTPTSLPAVSDSALGSADLPLRYRSRQTEYRVCWHTPAAQ